MDKPLPDGSKTVSPSSVLAAASVAARGALLGSAGYVLVILGWCGGEASAAQGAAAVALPVLIYLTGVGIRIQSQTVALVRAQSGDFSTPLSIGSVDYVGTNALANATRNLLATLREILQRDSLDWEVVREEQVASSRLQALIDQLPLGVISTDIDYRILLVNSEMKRLFELAGISEPTGGWVTSNLRAAHSSFEFLDERFPPEEREANPRTRLVGFGEELIEFNIVRVRDIAGDDVGLLLVGERMTDQIRAQVADRSRHESLGSMLTQISEILGPLVECAESLQTVGEIATENARLTSSRAEVVQGQCSVVSENMTQAQQELSRMCGEVERIADHSMDASEVASNAVAACELAKVGMQGLAKSGEAVFKVIALIRSISSQTNLLALNAAIEAASAGQFGRGFSVVANEVKALAGETAKATEEIEARINSIQHETKSAIGHIEEIDSLIELISDAQTKIVEGLMDEIERSGALNQRVTDATSNTAAIREHIVELAAASKHTISHTADSHQSAIMLASSAHQLTMLIRAFENCRADRPFEIVADMHHDVKGGDIELF